MRHRGFGKSMKIVRLADLRVNDLKVALAEVCAVRVLLVISAKELCIRLRLSVRLLSGLFRNY